jgi:hypothetical protein
MTLSEIEIFFLNYLTVKPSGTCSLSELEAEDAIEKQQVNKLIEFTNKFLVKVYPGFFRQDSSNLEPIDYWIYGMQIGKFYLILNLWLNRTIYIHDFVIL